MQSTPNIVCRVTRPSSRKWASSPWTIATGAAAASSRLTTLAPVSSTSPVAAKAIAAAMVTATMTTLLIRSSRVRACEIHSAARKVPPWSAIVITCTRSPAVVASWKVSEIRIRISSRP